VPRPASLVTITGEGEIEPDQDFFAHRSPPIFLCSSHKCDPNMRRKAQRQGCSFCTEFTWRSTCPRFPLAWPLHLRALYFATPIPANVVQRGDMHKGAGYPADTATTRKFAHAQSQNPIYRAAEAVAANGIGSGCRQALLWREQRAVVPPGESRGNRNNGRRSAVENCAAARDCETVESRLRLATATRGRGPLWLYSNDSLTFFAFKSSRAGVAAQRTASSKSCRCSACGVGALCPH
jgi:hypothetical protein